MAKKKTKTEAKSSTSVKSEEEKLNQKLAQKWRDQAERTKRSWRMEYEKGGSFQSKPSTEAPSLFPYPSNPEGGLVLRLFGTELPAVIRCYSASVLPGGMIIVRMESRESVPVYISPSSYVAAEVLNAAHLERVLVESAA